MRYTGWPPGQHDRDQDGWTGAGGDCDDSRSTVHPRRVERCNGRDDDCDGEVDERWERDGCLQQVLMEGISTDEDGAFVSGWWALAMRTAAGETVCQRDGTYVYLDEDVTPCVGCEWTFHLEGVDFGWSQGCAATNYVADAVDLDGRDGWYGYAPSYSWNENGHDYLLGPSFFGTWSYPFGAWRPAAYWYPPWGRYEVTSAGLETRVYEYFDGYYGRKYYLYAP